MSASTFELTCVLTIPHLFASFEQPRHRSRMPPPSPSRADTTGIQISGNTPKRGYPACLDRSDDGEQLARKRARCFSVRGSTIVAQRWDLLRHFKLRWLQRSIQSSAATNWLLVERVGDNIGRMVASPLAAQVAHPRGNTRWLRLRGVG